MEGFLCKMEEHGNPITDAEQQMYLSRKQYCKDHGKTCDQSCVIFDMCNEMHDRLFGKPNEQDKETKPAIQYN